MISSRRFFPCMGNQKVYRWKLMKWQRNVTSKYFSLRELFEEILLCISLMGVSLTVLSHLFNLCRCYKNILRESLRLITAAQKNSIGVKNCIVFFSRKTAELLQNSRKACKKLAIVNALCCRWTDWNAFYRFVSHSTATGIFQILWWEKTEKEKQEIKICWVLSLSRS